MNLETRNRGVRVIRTEKPQTAERPRASVAAHEMVLAPTGNNVSLAGVHVTATGAEPPDTVGLVYCTATGFPSADCTATSSGQVIDGASVGGMGVGFVGDEQAATSSAAETAAVTISGERPLPGADRMSMFGYYIDHAAIPYEFPLCGW
ncbi:MAG TPA: hypothetical protein VF332_02065 [Vicinamibacterales bacterium]